MCNVIKIKIALIPTNAWKELASKLVSRPNVDWMHNAKRYRTPESVTVHPNSLAMLILSASEVYFILLNIFNTNLIFISEILEMILKIYSKLKIFQYQ